MSLESRVQKALWDYLVKRIPFTDYQNFIFIKNMIHIKIQAIWLNIKTATNHLKCHHSE